MFASFGLFTVLIAPQLEGPCYVLYDAKGAQVYQSREPPFSRALPASAEAEASRARGEKLVVYSDRECSGKTAADPKRATGQLVAGGTGSADPPQFAPVTGKAGNGSFSFKTARPESDPAARVAYDPFAEGKIRGGLAAGMERVRQGMAAGNQEALSFLDTATLAETEGKEAQQRALRQIAEYEGERPDDAMYSCLLVDTMENCVSGRSSALLLNRAMNPGTTAYSHQRAQQTLALLGTYGMGSMAQGDAYVRGQGLPSQGISPSPADPLWSDLLRRAIQGDQEAIRTWLALHGQPQPAVQESRPALEETDTGGLQAGPAVAAPPPPRVSVEEAERLATEEEKQRKKWWIFQFPLDRRRITERTLEILEQSTTAPNPYKTRGEVFDAYRQGRLTHEQALRYLQAMADD